MPNQEVTVSDEISKFALHHTLKYKWEIGSNFNIANWILKSTRDNSNPCNSTCFSLPLRVGVTEHFPFSLKFRKFRLIHQMERTFRFQGPTSFDRSGHFGRSDWNAPFVVPSSGGSRGGPPPLIFRPNWGPKGPKFFFWDQTPLTPYIRVCMNAPPGSPLSEGLYPSTTAQYRSFVSCLQKKAITKRWVCATGMYRSIGQVKFPKFQTGIFVEWKAPRGGQTRPHNQRYPCPKCYLARRKPLASHWWNLERWLADALGQPLALESKRL